MRLYSVQWAVEAVRQAGEAVQCTPSSRISKASRWGCIVAYWYLDTFVNAWVEVHSRFLQIFCTFVVSFPLTLTVTCFYWHFFPLVRFPDYGPRCHQHQSEKTHQTEPSLKIQTLSLFYYHQEYFFISSWNKMYITMISCWNHWTKMSR